VFGPDGVPKKPGVHDAMEGCQFPNAVRRAGSQSDGKAIEAPSIIFVGFGYVRMSTVTVAV
jgi:hypothetical protein